RAIARHRRLDFVFLCPTEGDMAGDRNAGSVGMPARLLAGQPPRWLRPVTLPGLTEGKLYAVIP
ncbi:MAG TPA: hypothetical protein VKQ09_10265, partial [Sphingomonas sp.]|nr:hypothetical protein [Sphingomonas sp.]